MSKKCYKCKEIKDLGDFYKDIAQSDELQKACKLCQKKSATKWNTDNKEYRAAKRKERYTEDKLKNPKHNKERYANNQSAYLERKDKSQRSPRGRIYQVMDAARQRSRKKGIPFDLDLDFLLELFNNQEGRCLLTKIPFEFNRNKKGQRFYTPYAPSIDRIDPDKGYLKTNVRLVTVIVNLALNNFGEEVFEKMCRSYLQAKGAL